MQASPATPTQNRDLLPDALRGFALMGILLINAFPMSGYFIRVSEAAEIPAADQIIGLTVLTLVYGKFYVIFSFLFGLGFSYFLERAEIDPAAIRRFTRRLFILLLIGLVHLMFWMGDILFLYAATGFLLIPFRRAPTKTLLKAALFFWTLPLLLDLVYIVKPALDISPAIAHVETRLLAAWGLPLDSYFQRYYVEAQWGSFFRYNVGAIFFRFAEFWETGRLFKVLAMFLLGLAAGRAQLHRDITPLKKYLKPLATWGVAVGLPLNAPLALSQLMPPEPHSLYSLLAALAYWIGVPLLSAGWVSIFLLRWEKNRLGSAGTKLAAQGRMALSNYLAQTAMGLFVFIVLGFTATANAPAILGYIVAIWVLQLAWSPWWLGRFAYGPIEFLWRWATYGKRPSMRLPPHQ